MLGIYTPVEIKSWRSVDFVISRPTVAGRTAREFAGIFFYIIYILCKEFSGIDIFKLEYLTKSLNPKKMMAKNFRRPAYEKSKKIHCVLFIALHFYFICQLSKFLLLFLCQSAKFISKFRSYAQSRNWITQKGEVSILVVCFFFFFQLLRICSRLWR
jgi:hypothetical protein